MRSFSMYCAPSGPGSGRAEDEEAAGTAKINLTVDLEEDPSYLLCHSKLCDLNLRSAGDAEEQEPSAKIQVSISLQT